MMFEIDAWQIIVTILSVFAGLGFIRMRELSGIARDRNRRLDEQNRDLKEKLSRPKRAERLVLSCPDCKQVWIVKPDDCIFRDGNWCLDCNNESVTWDLTIEMGYDMLKSMARAEKKLRKRKITIGQDGMRPLCCG